MSEDRVGSSRSIGWIVDASHLSGQMGGSKRDGRRETNILHAWSVLNVLHDTSVELSSVNQIVTSETGVHFHEQARLRAEARICVHRIEGAVDK